jgi:hypothetical protein
VAVSVYHMSVNYYYALSCRHSASE